MMEQADLYVASAARLLNHETTQKDRILAACKGDGFFYLDYRNTDLESVTDLYRVATSFFDLPLAEKLKHDVEGRGPEKYDGYKTAGRSTGPVTGKRDGFEAFTIPDNSLFSVVPTMPFHGPPTIQKDRLTIQHSVRLMNNLALQILSLLSSALQLDPSQSFQASHRPGKPSTSATSLLKYVSEEQEEAKEKAGHMAHTDIGTLSIVFSDVPGLQVQLPHKHPTHWLDVPPKPGHAIINVGDCLTFLSEGRLPSVLHRVVPSKETAEVKFTLAYLLRPELDARLVDRDGKEWRGWDWHCNKFKVFRASLEEQSKDGVLTGRHGYLGLTNEGGKNCDKNDDLLGTMAVGA